MAGKVKVPKVGEGGLARIRTPTGTAYARRKVQHEGARPLPELLSPLRHGTMASTLSPLMECSYLILHCVLNSWCQQNKLCVARANSRGGSAVPSMPVRRAFWLRPARLDAAARTGAEAAWGRISPESFLVMCTCV